MASRRLCRPVLASEHRLEYLPETDRLPCDRFVIEAVERRAKQLAKLKLSDEKLSARLAENADRLDRFSEVLVSLEQTSATATRSPNFGNRRRDDQVKKDRR